MFSDQMDLISDERDARWDQFVERPADTDLPSFDLLHLQLGRGNVSLADQHLNRQKGDGQQKGRREQGRDLLLFFCRGNVDVLQREEGE